MYYRAHITLKLYRGLLIVSSCHHSQEVELYKPLTKYFYGEYRQKTNDHTRDILLSYVSTSYVYTRGIYINHTTPRRWRYIIFQNMTHSRDGNELVTNKNAHLLTKSCLAKYRSPKSLRQLRCHYVKLEVSRATNTIYKLPPYNLSARWSSRYIPGRSIYWPQSILHHDIKDIIKGIFRVRSHKQIITVVRSLIAIKTS